MEVDEIRVLYKRVEVRLLILLGITLPLFGVVYLYYNSGNLNWNLPALPVFVESLLMGLGTFVLGLQFILFRSKVKASNNLEELLDKIRNYSEASLNRIHLLTLSCLLDATGLLLFKNPFFVVLFAVTLVFFSLAKPSPDRIIRILKLSKKEADIIRLASRPKE